MRRLVKTASNERGQMAIFVALIFQVLFVFFAMAINVALVVHDKINLQNSVDLAAYYAAAKQAEVLNAIAHQNYQIRQAWKLLSWRYRVVGTLGYPGHPGRTGGDVSESSWPSAVGSGVCIGYSPYWKGGAQQNHCDEGAGKRIPPQFKVPDFAPWVSILFTGASDQHISNITEQCRRAGYSNFLYLNLIFASYRREMSNRKQGIQGLANNLSSSANDFTDISGESVREGAYKTLFKNLTYTNEQGFAAEDFRLFNSFGHPQLGNDPRTWLRDIVIHPAGGYIDFTPRGVAGCNASMKGIDEPPTAGIRGADGALNDYAKRWSGVGQVESYSLGFEKNPWVAGYIIVKARTRPRQLFFPLGGSIQMEARAIVKPFGGRIGPWYGQQWPSGAFESDSGSRTDPLTPVRMSSGGPVVSQVGYNLPNYSRFPGDNWGFDSRAAQGALNLSPTLFGLEFNQFANISNNLNRSSPLSTIVSRGIADPTTSNTPRYELAAAAPDLFDAYYYSVDLDYAKNYLGAGKLEGPNAFGSIYSSIPEFFLRPDFGLPGERRGDIRDQIGMRLGSGGASVVRPHAFWYIKDPRHLYTGWTQSRRLASYESFPADRFGKCNLGNGDPNKSTYNLINPNYPSVPGCPGGGGRTGYSVKFVTRSFLTGEIEGLGGPGTSGAIMNPPPEAY